MGKEIFSRIGAKRPNQEEEKVKNPGSPIENHVDFR
jgi:hypothetical protein